MSVSLTPSAQHPLGRESYSPENGKSSLLGLWLWKEVLLSQRRWRSETPLWNEPAASHTGLFISSFNFPSFHLMSAEVKVSNGWDLWERARRYLPEGWKNMRVPWSQQWERLRDTWNSKKATHNSNMLLFLSLILGKFLKGYKLINLVWSSTNLLTVKTWLSNFRGPR